MPFNHYNGYYPMSSYNYMKNQMAQNYQSIYNSGVMTDVIQSSNISQVGAGCTTPMSGEPMPEPPVTYASPVV
jgi:hypothetical protein